MRKSVMKKRWKHTQSWGRSIKKDWGIEYARYQQVIGCYGEHILNVAEKVLRERLKWKNNNYGNEKIVKLSEKQKKMRESTWNKKLKAKNKKSETRSWMKPKKGKRIDYRERNTRNRI